MEFSALGKGTHHLVCIAKTLYKKRVKIVVYFVIVGFFFPCIAFFLGGENGSSEMFKSMVVSNIIFIVLVGLVFIFALIFKLMCINWNLNRSSSLYEILDELCSLLGNILLIISGYCWFKFLTHDVSAQRDYGLISIAALYLYALIEYISNCLQDESERKTKEKADKKARTRQAD
ncbi:MULTISPECIES: hypothetical protein [Yersinia]|uniref:hypothetical protein n=1 Tax=Yersinia TaxID=629 RepID=UPI000BFEA064|nr:MULTISPECIES: hypothetical protein [Yersinia]ATM86055.1 hypothetical protein CRN74_08175 [Yersinia frederiksenii]MCB5317454.1 hypothetical protein [Yersinia massiliensis]